MQLQRERRWHGRRTGPGRRVLSVRPLAQTQAAAACRCALAEVCLAATRAASARRTCGAQGAQDCIINRKSLGCYVYGTWSQQSSAVPWLPGQNGSPCGPAGRDGTRSLT